MAIFSMAGAQDGHLEPLKTPWIAQQEQRAAEAAWSREHAHDPSANTSAPAELDSPARTRSRRRKLMIAPVAFAVLTALLIGAHQGRLLELFFPVGAFGVAALLYKRSPAHYVGFVYWLFFLTPEVRRFSDYFNGVFSERSLIMIAPLLAAALSGITVLTHAHVLMQRRAVPLTLIILGLLYGFVIGMVGAGFAAAVFSLFTWLFPVTVAFHILVTWRHYPDYHRTMLKTFIFGGFLIAAYGVWQYVSPQPWDAFWLRNANMLSEGTATPFGMRVSSTMNSSGPFAVTMMVALLVCVTSRSKLGVLTGAIAVPALIGTMSRSVLGGLAIGLLYVFIMLDGRSRIRLVVAMAVLIVLCAPVAMIDEVSDKALARINTVTELDHDDSYQVRTEIYHHFFAEMSTNIAGRGLGMTGLGSKLGDSSGGGDNVNFDSGLMEVPYVLGWPGALLYAGGVFSLLYRALIASGTRKHDRFAIANVASGVSLLAMMVFINTLTGFSGQLFFAGTMLAVIGRRYALETTPVSGDAEATHAPLSAHDSSAGHAAGRA